MAASREPKSYLVHPSGSITAKVTVKLPYPTFTSSLIHNVETPDPSSLCPRLLLRKGFTKANTFFYEKFFRRVSKDDWPSVDPELAELQKEFSIWSENAMHAKVVIVCGKAAGQDYIARRKPYVRSLLCVNTSRERLELGILRDEHGNISQVAILAFHPKFM
jgi:hypothetical protein